MVEHMADKEIWGLSRGGHDYRKMYAAYDAATKHRGQPTVILAKTVKGWTLGSHFEGRNSTHQMKKLKKDDLISFRTVYAPSNVWLACFGSGMARIGRHSSVTSRRPRTVKLRRSASRDSDHDADSARRARVLGRSRVDAHRRQRYYRIMREAILAADPQALYLGDRLPIYYDPDAVRAMGDYVDVIATNYNVDGPDGWIARYYFQGLRRLAPKPVLVTEWFFAAHENRTGNLNRTGYPRSSDRSISSSNNVNRTGHLMTVATQDARAIGAAAATEALAREPNVVGLHWFQLYDHPKGGRADGEDYNFGLVDVRDRPYEQLVAALSRVNKLVSERRRESG